MSQKYLITGLGNPGPEYANTRHNIGFLICDQLVQQLNGTFKADRYASVAEVKLKGKLLVVIKPSTFMNLSGKSVRYWLDKYSIDPSQSLTITDDLALPFAKIRIKPKGSDGGHNGLKHITEILGNDLFPRLRFGIGSDFPKGHQSEYVLGNFNADEINILQDSIYEKTVLAIQSFCLEGIERAMNQFNTK